MPFLTCPTPLSCRLVTLVVMGWILTLGACFDTWFDTPPDQTEPSSSSAQDDGRQESEIVPVEIHAPDGRIAAAYERSFALLIGVSSYSADYWPELSSVSDELDEVGEALLKHGFEVETFLDPKDGLKAVFEDFIHRHGHEPENRLLFFVAGHGYTLGDGRTGYLVPAAAPDPTRDEPGFVDNALPMSQIINWAGTIKANHALFVFDSCLPGTTFQTEQVTDQSSPISDLTSRRVRQFITAGSAWEKEPTKSVFVPALIRALDGQADFNPDGFVTGTELGYYVREELLSHDVNQTPQYGKLADPELDRRGEFVFRLASGGRESTPASGGEESAPASGGEESAPASGGEESAPASGGEESAPAPGGEESAPAPGGEESAPASRAEESTPTSGGEIPAEVRAAWEGYLREMGDRFAEVERFELPASEMVTAWTEFLQDYAADAPLSDRDEELRREAEARLEIWRRAAAAPPPPPVVVDPSPPPVAVDPSPPEAEVDPSSTQDGPVQAADSALLLKVVGLSDNISIVDGSSNVLSTMETLKPYFVLEDTGDSYRISSRQEKSDVQEFVTKKEVAKWNTREGLRFLGDTFSQNRRAVVAAWESEERIRKYAETWDEKRYGANFKEPAQTRVATDDIIPYPLLETKEITGPGGAPTRIHQVLIPTIVAGTLETPLTPEEVEAAAGAVTFCVVFDATASMDKYARRFADTIDEMLSEPDIDEELAAVGFVLFRDIKDAQRFEIVQPMPMDDAMKWLRGRVKHMEGGDDPAEPVLDAMILAQDSFLWNDAIRGAKRVAIVVANKAAKLETVDLTGDGIVPRGLDAKGVGQSLRKNNIHVFTLQAGFEDRGNLVDVLSTLAVETGGEFYGMGRSIKSFSKNLETIVSRRIAEGDAAAEGLGPHIFRREGGGTVIALHALDEDMRNRLREAAQEYHISSGGLVITKAWVFEQPDLYREEILIEKELLERLVRFFGVLTDDTLDAASLQDSTARLLAAMTGEDLRQSEEVQGLLEKKLGIHFTTNLLSFQLERLATLNPEERSRLQESIRKAADALAKFHDRNAKRFNKEPRIWMQVEYLP